MFLVLGLPRSRTAWIANFMTYSGLHCSHEGINGCHSLKEYFNNIQDGDANTGLYHFNFEKHMPEGTKIIIIDSDIDNALKYGKEHYGIDASLLHTMKDRLDTVEGLHINFNSINDNLETMWNYITDKPFDTKRADMLIGLNIQVNDFEVDTIAYEALMESEQYDTIF